MILQLKEQPTQERCVTLHGVSWDQFETIESALESIAGVKLTYLDGTLDSMTPLSPEHEDSKSTISLLLKAYLREKGIQFYVRGGPTLELALLVRYANMNDQYNAVNEFTQAVRNQVTDSEIQQN